MAYEDALEYNRDKLIGTSNIYGTVVGYKEPEYISSNYYDTILIFDSGMKCRWKAYHSNPFGKMSYYQSDEYNLKRR